MSGYFWVNKKINKFLFGFIIISISSVISAYFSLDHLGYQGIFSRYGETPFVEAINEVVYYELFFIMLSKVFSEFNVFICFAFVAACSFSIKLNLIEKASRDIFLSLLIFFSFFFLLHDSTGIRVSLAIAISFYGLYFLSKDRPFSYFFCVLISALFFHYSLFVFFVTFLLRTVKTAYFLLAFWVILIVLYYVGFTFTDLLIQISEFLGRGFTPVDKLYLYINRGVGDAAPFSKFFLGLFFVSIIAFFKYKNNLNKFELYCFNSLFLSFVILALLSQTPEIQNRLSEIFRVAIVFIFPLYYMLLVEIIRSKKIAMLITYTGLFLYFIYFSAFKGMIVL